MGRDIADALAARLSRRGGRLEIATGLPLPLPLTDEEVLEEISLIVYKDAAREISIKKSGQTKKMDLVPGRSLKDVANDILERERQRFGKERR